MVTMCAWCQHPALGVGHEGHCAGKHARRDGSLKDGEGSVPAVGGRGGRRQPLREEKQAGEAEGEEEEEEAAAAEGWRRAREHSR